MADDNSPRSSVSLSASPRNSLFSSPTLYSSPLTPPDQPPFLPTPPVDDQPVFLSPSSEDQHRFQRSNYLPDPRQFTGYTFAITYEKDTLHNTWYPRGVSEGQSHSHRVTHKMNITPTANNVGAPSTQPTPDVPYSAGSQQTQEPDPVVQQTQEPDLVVVPNSAGNNAGPQENEKRAVNKPTDPIVRRCGCITDEANACLAAWKSIAALILFIATFLGVLHTLLRKLGGPGRSLPPFSTQHV